MSSELKKLLRTYINEVKSEDDLLDDFQYDVIARELFTRFGGPKLDQDVTAIVDRYVALQSKVNHKKIDKEKLYDAALQYVSLVATPEVDVQKKKK